MQALKTWNYILQFTIVLLFGCSKEESTLNENSMSCKINGIEWKTKEVNFYIYNGPNGSTIDISGINTSGTIPYDVLELLIPSAFTTGNRGIFQNNSGPYSTEYQGSMGGNIVINKNDTNSIEGIFYFNATNNINPQDIIEVTEGKFTYYH